MNELIGKCFYNLKYLFDVGITIVQNEFQSLEIQINIQQRGIRNLQRQFNDTFIDCIWEAI